MMVPRMRVTLALLFTILVVFTGRLMFLQLARSDEFTARSVLNSTEEQRILPLRGRILARDGTVLADDRIAYDLLYTGGAAPGWERLKALLGTDAELREPDPSKPEEIQNGAVLVWNIPDTLVPAVEERVAGNPNLYLRERVERTYPTNLAAQTIGYTAQADPTRHIGYSVNDLVGVMGIEAAYEAALFGSAGMREVEVDNRGTEVASFVRWTASPGLDVTLTIDPQLQRLAEDVLADSLSYVNQDRERVGLPLTETVRGSIVAIDPRNGEVLAMASAPTFDQNVFTHRPSDPEAVIEILGDTANKPLANRAVEAYPPASTFKVVTSSTLLEYGYAGRNTTYPCTSAFRFGGITWRNWATYDKGAYNILHAIADSCNTYFWYAAYDTPNFSVGWAPFIEDLVERARQFGLGEPVGVGLMEEKAGRIPDEDWVKAQPQYNHGWLPGFTLNTVIGQGDVLATPIQIAQLVSTLAMDGRMAHPHLVKRIGDQVMEPVVEQVEGDHWQTLRDGMTMMFTDYPSRNYMGPQV
ncbi:MAG TPA: penicillin-binding transpeptidase domain-containing protein, partial [Trueperaceae bacterium]|nr:penicillin-binding transpeptidase domain-containing protein [Trueperaceae bacterium]